jgi:hypothetical protein
METDTYYRPRSPFTDMASFNCSPEVELIHKDTFDLIDRAIALNVKSLNLFSYSSSTVVQAGKEHTVRVTIGSTCCSCGIALAYAISRHNKQSTCVISNSYVNYTDSQKFTRVKSHLDLDREHLSKFITIIVDNPRYSIPSLEEFYKFFSITPRCCQFIFLNDTV